VILLFGLARLVPFARARPGFNFDSFDYLSVARQASLFGALGAHRPPVYVLLLKALAENRQAVTWVQIAIGLGAWVWLAFATARNLATRLGRTIGFAGVLLLGSCLDVVQWDRVIGTESLSISFGVMIVAAVLWWREALTPLGAATLGALVFLWAMLRDANALVAAAAGAAVLIGSLAVRRRIERPLLIVSCVAIATGAGAVVSGNVGNRWQQPTQNVITFRVLPSEERASYFLRHGLPLTRIEANDLAGHCANPAGAFLCKKVTKPAFYDWIDQHARGVYVRSWFAFPIPTLVEPLTHERMMTGTRVPVAAITGTRLHASYAASIESIVYPRSPWIVLAWLVGVLVALAAALRAGMRVRLAGIALALLALAYVHLWVVWTGDAVELERHGLVAALQIVLGLWLLSLSLIDALLLRFASSSRREVPTSDPHEGSRS
jgi:hypothetical protein